MHHGEHGNNLPLLCIPEKLEESVIIKISTLTVSKIYVNVLQKCGISRIFILKKAFCLRFEK